jgi:prolyl-tRNA synthetase
MLDVYRSFVEEQLAMPVIVGEKTASERFPGAENTFCIEAMMQDRKALQAGTSHFLAQNFSKASNILYQTRDGNQAYAWTTSWGASTRLIGGMIMVHGDDNGMIMPPRVSPRQIVILPIIRKGENESPVLVYCNDVADELRNILYHGKAVDVIVDTRDMNAGEKSWDWIKKGVPVIVEVGPRDLKNNCVFVGRRDRSRTERYSQNKKEFLEGFAELLDDIHNTLFERAKNFRDSHTHRLDDWDSFETFFTPKRKDMAEIHGGFALSHWCTSAECEEAASNRLGVTIRCIPLDQEDNSMGKCIVCGKESRDRVIFAKAY